MSLILSLMHFACKDFVQTSLSSQIYLLLKPAYIVWGHSMIQRHIVFFRSKIIIILVTITSDQTNCKTKEIKTVLKTPLISIIFHQNFTSGNSIHIWIAFVFSFYNYAYIFCQIVQVIRCNLKTYEWINSIFSVYRRT